MSNEPALNIKSTSSTCKLPSLCKTLWGVWATLTATFLGVSLWAVSEAKLGQAQAGAMETKLEKVELSAKASMDIHRAKEDEQLKNILEKLELISNDLKEIKKK